MEGMNVRFRSPFRANMARSGMLAEHEERIRDDGHGSFFGRTYH